MFSFKLSYRTAAENAKERFLASSTTGDLSNRFFSSVDFDFAKVTGR
jgi:hypothetical protein